MLVLICRNDPVLTLDRGERWAVTGGITPVMNSNSKRIPVDLGIKIRATLAHSNSPIIVGTELCLATIDLRVRVRVCEKRTLSETVGERKLLGLRYPLTSTGKVRSSSRTHVHFFFLMFFILLPP